MMKLIAAAVVLVGMSTGVALAQNSGVTKVSKLSQQTQTATTPTRLVHRGGGWR